MRLLFVSLAVAGLAGCQPADAPVPQTRADDFSALVTEPKTLLQVVGDVRSGSLTAEAVTQAYLGRIAAVDDGGPTLNAVIATNPRALDEARELDRLAGQGGSKGPLHGAPVLIKDNIDALGMATTAGSLALKENIPERDSPLVARLRAAGAVILGKTNLSEWANFRSNSSSSGWSGVGGQTKNPHVLDRNPCGSSSGSGAAVAAGLAAFAIGTETDGSIVCPSGANGVVGIKPTVGLVPRTFIVPISSSQDTAGPMALTVSDAALALSVIAGSDPSDPSTLDADKHKQDYTKALDARALQGKRIGVARFMTGYHGPTDELFEQAMDELKKAGATLVDIKEAPKGRGEMGSAEFTVLLAEFKAGVEAYLASASPAVKAKNLNDLIAFNSATPAELAFFNQDIFEAAAKAPALTDQAYLTAKATARRLAGQDGIDAMLRDNDVVAIVAPTGGPAWTTDLVTGDRFLGSSSSYAAIAGYPNITVPMGKVHDLPVGLSFFGTAWSEPTLLGLAFAYEQQTKARTAPKFLPHSP